MARVDSRDHGEEALAILIITSLWLSPGPRMAVSLLTQASASHMPAARQPNDRAAQALKTALWGASSLSTDEETDRKRVSDCGVGCSSDAPMRMGMTWTESERRRTPMRP